MSHKPLIIQELSLSFAHKVCFENFSTQIVPGDKIALTGRNGAGKSSLLKIIAQKTPPTSGSLIIPPNTICAYVPQIIEEHPLLSGGQKINKALTQALAQDPDILLLDEPTNHLDHNNRINFLRMLKRYTGTLIVVSHDSELLNTCVTKIWHIDHETITVFTGSYNDYLQEQSIKKQQISLALSHLKKEKKAIHTSLMKEQQKTAHKKTQGEKKKEQKRWNASTTDAKITRAQTAQGSKLKGLSDKRQSLLDELAALYVPETVVPTFTLSSHNHTKNLITITHASIGYTQDQPLLDNISLCVNTTDRIALLGDNGSGKSTLLKALISSPLIIKTGSWSLCKPDEIGYLDQHYKNLNPEKTVFESIQELQPSWPHTKVREHLNNFLFRKNEEVSTPVNNLSGGEKARLSLACIAAKTPQLLLLDEITNNLDLETRMHIIEVLQKYPGALIVISHDTDFLQKIGITSTYTLEKKHLKLHHSTVESF